MQTGDSAAIGLDVVRGAVADAVRAPSVHNTQPWRFGVRGSRISLRADPDRRLDVADPYGREMLISCGAALYNLRLALRKRGYEPDVRLLPDADRPYLLADVEARAVRDPVPDETGREYAQIARRHSHRGGFRPDPVPAGVVEDLARAADREGARLIEAADVHVTGALAALTGAAEHIQRRTPAYMSELVRWAPSPASTRRDGVQPEAYPKQTPRMEPDFAARDFARGHGWGADPRDGEAGQSAEAGQGETGQGKVRQGEAEQSESGGAEDDGATGVVLLLVTAGDGPDAWLRAGEALERVLLVAAGHGLAAAYHTQAMQVPELRESVRAHFCDGAYPQLLLRFGVPARRDPASVRRPVEDVMVVEP
ncbi:hypothetical protein DZF91_36510 [Actinomadura logoneensis]|uniref:Nitroreductase n=2 Tax=Actinomadura logoneensis TaxID=2293572 RepID=A0A372JBH6_9ACTN|nr:hypothetical protein DZF91_36510 [Actinomadura logoneensis]